MEFNSSSIVIIIDVGLLYEADLGFPPQDKGRPESHILERLVVVIHQACSKQSPPLCSGAAKEVSWI